MPERTKQLAKMLLKQYGYLGTFDVDPMNESDCEGLAQAFKAWGYDVARDPHSTRLIISQPDTATSKENARSA